MTATDRPRLLDLFCGAGGAGMGYHRAGYEVVGVDIAKQPRYPFTLIQGDALEYVRRHGREFDAIHASPPCQAYTRLRALHDRQYVDLVQGTRDMLRWAGKPWVIENVPGAPLIRPIVLCGTSFGLTLYRHRLFESSFWMEEPEHQPHTIRIGTNRGGYEGNGPWVTVAGHNFDVAKGRAAMGIDWMTGKELAQSIPPAYTEYVGICLLIHTPPKLVDNLVDNPIDSCR